MDDKNLNTENNDIYRAMPNMNTAIENPDVNLSGVMDVNIKDVDNSFSVNNSSSQVNIGNSIINKEIEMANVYNNQGIVGQSNVYTNSIVQSNQASSPDINQVSLGQTVATNNIDINHNVGLINQTSKQDSSISNAQADKFVGVSNDGNVVTQRNESNVKEVYKPTFKSKTKPKKGLVIPKELFVLIIIAGILFLFLFVMPYIYEFFRNLNFAVVF